VGRNAAKDRWTEKPDAQDYPAAEEYLSLVIPPAAAKTLVRRLRNAAIAKRKAKDLLRASALPLLAPDDYHVAKDLKKVAAGQLLSPVLVIRGMVGVGVPLIVADGYHRICAGYHLDQDANIPCRMVDLAKGK
jgi:hypothetical protein